MIREYIKQLIDNAIEKTPELSKTGVKIDYTIERPRLKKHGDFSVNIAMLAAPILKKSPMQIAEAILKNIEDAKGYLEKTEIAKPGFINLFFKNEWYYKVLNYVEEKDEKYGEIEVGAGKKVLLEYVSANPVGPLHIGHGRWAAVGDSLAKTLRKAGFNVQTEFYVNNYGRQMNLFFASVEAAYRNLFGEKVEPPEDGYKGAYINDIAKNLREELNKAFDQIPENDFRSASYNFIVNQIKETLKNIEVSFDSYFEEKQQLHEKDLVNKAIAYLKKQKIAYEKDGALWLKTSQFGDEKDRVLIRSNGEKTYFAADIAYHKDKLDRGFDKLINIWGADHHGYIARVKAAIAALGKDPNKLEVILGQLVNLFQEGKPVKMSKRTGDLITLDELIDEVGVNAVRFTFLTKSTDTPLDFDINLAKEQSDKNPVYYVQYAHARISSIMRFAAEKGVKYAGAKKVDFNLLKAEAEIDLIKTLEEFEEIVEVVSRNLTPHLLTTYAQKLATAFHSFYTVSRVITDDEKLTQARLGLLDCTHITLRNVLELLGVSAPEKM